MKIIQKRFPKGSREFEIIDDAVYVRVKGFLKEEKLAIDLSKLNPDPVVNGSELVFRGRAGHGLTLSLFLDKPSADEFNAFVDALKQGILAEDKALAGVEVSHEVSRPDAPGWNVYAEPPSFEEAEEALDETVFPSVNVERMDGDITMLRTYLDDDAIKPLIDSLETLKSEPDNKVAFKKMLDTYNGLGIYQGAVLTYAPYLKALLSLTIR